MRYFFVFILSLALAPVVPAWGPEGHRIVGAIADQRLAETETGRQVALLLDGFTLEKAALIPDEIKGWDKDGPDKPGIFHYTSRPRIDEQLTAFWKANPPTRDHASSAPSHHWFHYTDVPVVSGARYGEGKAGRSRWDIVQTMKYCLRVLEGTEPEDNPRAITKPIAIILLAHFVGDLHQPMHVGAQFYDRQGRPADPDKVDETFPNHGGNTITLWLDSDQRKRARPKLHSFWDSQAVTALFPPMPDEIEKEERRRRTDENVAGFVARAAGEEPAGWKMPGDLPLTAWPETWADEVLPLAHEAYDRLRFGRVTPREIKGEMSASGRAYEAKMPDGIGYLDWASTVARRQVHLAGWRLADLLENALAAPSAGK